MAQVNLEIVLFAISAGNNAVLIRNAHGNNDADRRFRDFGLALLAGAFLHGMEFHRKGVNASRRGCTFYRAFFIHRHAVRQRTVNDGIRQCIVSTICKAIANMNNWREKETTRAEMAKIIRDTLWHSLPTSYTDADMTNCRQKIYTFVVERSPMMAGAWA